MMTYTKSELLEVMEQNNQYMKFHKDRKAAAEKILKSIAAFEAEYEKDITTLADLFSIISDSEEMLDKFKGVQAKRKKQLKLLEQMEALENE